MKKRNYELTGTPTRGNVDAEWDDPYTTGDQAGYGRDPEAGNDFGRQGAEALEEEQLWRGTEQLGHISLDNSIGSSSEPPELSPEEVKRLRGIGVKLEGRYDEDGKPIAKESNE